jgi:hypothetical protein
MPGVEENPGFVAWPPPFTANGVLFAAKMHSYNDAGQKKLVSRTGLPYNLAHVLDTTWLHRASGGLGARSGIVGDVGQIIR